MKNDRRAEKVTIAAGQLLAERKFWLGKLTGKLVKSNFPYDRQKKEKGGRYSPSRLEFKLEGDLFNHLMRISSGSDPRLHIVLTASLILLIYKYTYDEKEKQDIIVGTTIDKQETEGEFINTILPLRNRLKHDTTFRELLMQVRETMVEAIENQNYPVETLTGEINWEFDDKDEFPLFDVAIILENIQDKRYLKPIEPNVIFSFNKTGKELEGSVLYNTLLYEETTIDRIIAYFGRLLQNALSNVDLPLEDIDILSKEEKEQLVYGFNDTKSEYPRDKTIYRLFEEQVEKTPTQVAVVGEGLGPGHKQMTFQQLNETANRLARVLRTRGVKPGKIAGIVIDCSRNMIVAVLAVLKAGGAYLPIDPVGTPMDRIRFIMDDGNPSILLVDSGTLAKHPLTVLKNLRSLRLKPYVTAPRPQVKDFDRLPFPDRSLVDYETYNKWIGQALVKHRMACQATRGCPYHCAYCHKIWPKTHVFRSAENLFAEIRMLYNLGIKRFEFLDDSFNLNKKNGMKFFRMILENKLDIRFFFPNGLRGDVLTKEYIDLMVEAGTIQMALALETASPRVQKLIRKNLNIEKFRENVQYITTNYPQVILDLFTMHGFPTETREEAMMTLNFIKSVKWFHFPYAHILKIYPNTDMTQIAIENGISIEDILRSDHLAHHQPTDLLPFDKSFTLKYQSNLLNEYFLLKERLLHVLKYQMKIIGEDELVQKYDNFLPVRLTGFSDLLNFVGITRGELETKEFFNEDSMLIPDLNSKLKKCFPRVKPGNNALRILILDLAQFFSNKETLFLDAIEPPLGPMYVMTYLKKQLGGKINGKIAKASVDFDSYEELKVLLEEFKPGVIGIRSLIYYKEFVHQTAAMIRQWGIDVPIIIGGPYGTSSYNLILQDKNIALAVLGEGEITFCELIEKIIENDGKLPEEEVLKEIKGIAFIPGQERRRENFAPEVLNLDMFDPDIAGEPAGNLRPLNRPGDLAYLIYTSGSTGKPKGVMVDHRGLVNYCWWAAKTYVKNEKLNFPFFTPLSFDLTVTSVYVPLITGNTIMVYTDDYKELLVDRIFADNQIGIVKLSPSHLKLIRDKKMTHSNIRRFIVGGEDLEMSLAKDIYENFHGNVEIYNEYGPTETVVGCMIYKFNPGEGNRKSVPIGIPADNVQIYLLDRNQKPVPPGTAGEIYISGDGAARGYSNRPRVTQEKFIYNPFLPGRQMYCSGDLGRFLPDGNIEFLGRIDHQVKIRGFRIELNEIEHRMLKHGKVKEVVVTAREDKGGEQYLCAYWVPTVPGEEDTQRLSIQKLKEFLLYELPEYMLPAFFVKLDKMPLAPSGKIDRKKLPKPEIRGSEEDYEPPRDEVEKILVQTWSELLGIEKIGINDNFFELGGDSIKSIQIAARIRNRGIKIEIRDIFENPTIKKLAPRAKTVKRSIYQGIVAGEVELTPVQGWLFEGNFTHIHHLNHAVMLYREKGFDEKIIKKVFEKLLQHHDALRMAYQYKEDGKRVVQWNRGLEGKLFHLEIMDMSDTENIEIKVEKQANRIQEGFNLETGPLVRLGLFKTSRGDHLLIVVHHLVMDGVSWRILFEDFTAGYRQAAKGEDIQFPDKTDSFKYWAEKLKEYAASKEALKELPYWKALEESKIKPLPGDFELPPQKNKIKYTGKLTVKFTKDESQKLSKEVHRAYNTEINDILLTALALAMKNWKGIDKVLINLEGHGREPIMEDVDTSRTIGWYTGNYPVLLDVSQASDLALAIKFTKETLRNIPNKGIGYGILKYLTPGEKKKSAAFSLNPDISFNYLGEFGREFKDNNESIRFSGFPTGHHMSPELERFFVIDIEGMVVNSRLIMSFAYNSNEYKKNSIEKLAGCYKSALSDIIRHCTGKKEKEYTPSDFTKKDLDMAELDEVLEVVKSI